MTKTTISAHYPPPHMHTHMHTHTERINPGVLTSIWGYVTTNVVALMLPTSWITTILKPQPEI